MPEAKIKPANPEHRDLVGKFYCVVAAVNDDRFHKYLGADGLWLGSAHYFESEQEAQETLARSPAPQFYARQDEIQLANRRDREMADYR